MQVVDAIEMMMTMITGDTDTVLVSLVWVYWNIFTLCWCNWFTLTMSLVTLIRLLLENGAKFSLKPAIVSGTCCSHVLCWLWRWTGWLALVSHELATQWVRCILWFSAVHQVLARVH